MLSQNVDVIQSDENKCTRKLLNSAKLLIVRYWMMKVKHFCQTESGFQQLEENNSMGICFVMEGLPLILYAIARRLSKI